MDKKELKPCLCGKKVKVQKWESGAYSIECDHCPVVFDNNYTNEDELIKAWNTRPQISDKEIGNALSSIIKVCVNMLKNQPSGDISEWNLPKTTTLKVRRKIVDEMDRQIEINRLRSIQLKDAHDIIYKYLLYRTHAVQTSPSLVEALKMIKAISVIGYCDSAEKDKAFKEIEIISDQALHRKEEKYVVCPECNGDGKETCTNPDHGLINALSFHDIGRIGCPCCGHDPNHKVPNGGDCEICNGTGKTTIKDAQEYISQYDYEIKLIPFAPVSDPQESEKECDIIGDTLSSIAKKEGKLHYCPDCEIWYRSHKKECPKRK